MKKMKEYWQSYVEKNGKKKAVATIVLLCVVLAGLICIPVYMSLTTTKEQKETIDYLSYVDGLKNWEVEIGDETNFLEDVTWDKDYIAKVTVDDEDVDLEKEGTYTIVYTIDVKKEGVNALKSKKTVDVIQSKNKEEKKEDSSAEKEEKEETKTESASNQNKKADSSSKKNVDSSKSNSSSSQSSGSSQKGESQASHQHNWVEQTKTVHHNAVTEQQWIVDVPAYTEERTICNQCGQDISGFAAQHLLDNMPNCFSYGSQWVTVPEQGHYETVTVQEAWDEQVVTGYRCSQCGATK